MPSGLIEARQVPFDRLLALDGALFPAARPGFLANWISQPDSVALCAHEEGGLSGFGVIRPCRLGHKIGPLYAAGPRQAEALVLGLCRARGGGGPVFLDVPEPNPAALALAQSLGLTPAFETARMYHGPAPALETRRLFGVTSFELG
jgi:hypothetical protein